jgi:FtsP/CotA-like multicopper oxidase with cupredoxin domain
MVLGPRHHVALVGGPGHPSPDRRTFDGVASDGGLLAVPVEVDAVQLSTAERTEMVVELSPGETTALVSPHPSWSPETTATFAPPERRLRRAPAFLMGGRCINGRLTDMGRVDGATPPAVLADGREPVYVAR